MKYQGCPPIILEFLLYLETIRNLSSRTVEAYWIDLRTFFRYLYMARGIVDKDSEFGEISAVILIHPLTSTNISTSFIVAV